MPHCTFFKLVFLPWYEMKKIIVKNKQKCSKQETQNLEIRHAAIKSKALRLFVIYLHVTGQKSTKLQRSLLPQSQVITSTVAVNWEVSISSCLSPEIIPNCLLLQAVLRTSQRHQRLLHRAALTDLLSPILLQHRLTLRCLRYCSPAGAGQVSTCRKQKAKGGKKSKPKSRCYAFLRLHDFLKVAFISNSYCSAGEPSQITAMKTEIILIPFIANHKSIHNIHYLNLL